MAEAMRSVDIVRVRGAVRAAEIDRAATEEPLEVRLHGRPFAVIMRTPGADRELAAGFLLAERVLRSADDLGAIAHCTDATAEHPENVVNVTLVNGADAALEALLAERRQVTTNSSCGMCGRRSIESLATDVPPITCAWTMRGSVLASLPDRVRARQSLFHETGGLHAAALCSPEGDILDVAEDVGRHNAVDKIVGRMLMREALPLSQHAAVRERPHVVRDRPEGGDCGHPDRGGGVGAVEPRDRARARVRHHARGLPPRRQLQSLLAPRARRGVSPAIFGLGQQKPHHYREMARIAWDNRDQLPFAWRILRDGVCDGCALGTSGLHDWTVEGPHLCMVRLELMRLNTAPALDPAAVSPTSERWRRAPRRICGRSAGFPSRCCAARATADSPSCRGTRRSIAWRARCARSIPIAWRSI